MADAFALARFRASVLPPAPRYVRPERTAEERAQLLLKTATMDEIRLAAQLLGLTFNEAYRERQKLYDERWLRR